MLLIIIKSGLIVGTSMMHFSWGLFYGHGLQIRAIEVCGVLQQAHTFGAIANFVVNSRSRFARNIILVENNQFRSLQLTPSARRLVATLSRHCKY